MTLRGLLPITSDMTHCWPCAKHWLTSGNETFFQSPEPHYLYFVLMKAFCIAFSCCFRCVKSWFRCGFLPAAKTSLLKRDGLIFASKYAKSFCWSLLVFFLYLLFLMIYACLLEWFHFLSYFSFLIGDKWPCCLDLSNNTTYWSLTYFSHVDNPPKWPLTMRMEG